MSRSTRWNLGACGAPIGLVQAPLSKPSCIAVFPTSLSYKKSIGMWTLQAALKTETHNFHNTTVGKIYFDIGLAGHTVIAITSSSS